MYITTHYPNLIVDGNNLLTIHLKYVKTSWNLFQVLQYYILELESPTSNM